MHRRRASWLPEFFFIIGALLILVTFVYSLARGWPSFDPLVTSLLVGIGLILIVVYERLGLMLGEVQRIAATLDAEGPRYQPPPGKEGEADR